MATGRPTDRPEHSPLGASSAERWMNCPGSNALLDRFALPETEEPDYRREGTAMHSAAARCLEDGVDAWEMIGQTFNETVIDEDMALAIQVYLDTCREDMDTALRWGIEEPLQLSAHELAYGTADWWAEWTDRLKVRDLKGGKGILVEPKMNPQIMYYAAGVIDQHPQWADDMAVDLEIVQPRGFHPDGPIRSWPTTVGFIREWVTGTLVPAMRRAQIEKSFDAGDWCRFCPAKMVCPLLTSLFRAACTADPREIVTYDDASLDRSYRYLQALDFYKKAINDEVLRRLLAGRLKGAENVKLVYKRTNRILPGGVEAELRQNFGAEVMTAPELKSPAELEKINAKVKAWVREHAFTPEGGLTVAAITDSRPAVTPPAPASEQFKAALAAELGD